jgi:glycosyltransferase involved in cell wall biosynthesis
MKILQVIPYFTPAYSYGGPVKVCHDISKELVKRGHRVTVATTDALDNKNRIKKSQETIENIKIIRFKNLSNFLAKNCNGFLPINFFFWAKNNIKNFEIVHCHDFFTLQNIITAYFCKKYNVPFIVQPHGTLSPIRQNAKFKNLKKLFLNLFKNVLTNSKNIIALTKNEKNEIIQINQKLEKKIKVIPNGIEIAEFQNIKKINLYKKYKIPEKNKIIGYIGRIQYIKGLDISLEILASLKKKLDFTYLIIGPDEGEKNNLEKKIKKLNLEKNVLFTGILEGDEKLETIKSCNLFLFTSRSEGLPMTILEIATLGIPQIISENCNVPEIENFGAGKVFVLNHEKAIAENLLTLLKNKKQQLEMSKNAIKMIKERFELNKICDRIEDVYKN